MAEAGDAQVASILAILPAAQEFMPNIEDHNFLADQRQIAASRHRWMSIGRHLQASGLIDAADDVFFIEAIVRYGAVHARIAEYAHEEVAATASGKCVASARRRRLRPD